MAVTATYTRRKPEEGILYNAVCQEWPKIRAMSKAANDGHGLPDFIEDAVDDYRKCGVLKYGFLYAKCGVTNEMCSGGSPCPPSADAATWLSEFYALAPAGWWSRFFGKNLEY